jgi:monoterpene epsilon-lactone hydrolase
VGRFSPSKPAGEHSRLDLHEGEPSMMKLVLFAVLFCGVCTRVFFRRLQKGPKHASWSLPYEVATDLMGTLFVRGLPALTAGKYFFQPPSPVPPGTASKVRHSKSTWAGLPAEIHVPKGAAATDAGATLLYLHGGGYIGCHPGTHRELISRLTVASGCRAIAIDYRKAPHHPYPAALDDALAAYDALRAEGVPAERIFVGGDSAGGGLALALSLTLRERGQPMPRGLVLLSPWVDLEGTHESMHTNEQYDYLSRALTSAGSRLYANGRSLRDPMLSPIHADLRGLPDMFIQHGTLELFASEDAVFAEKARAAGVNVRYEAWPNQVHVFQAFASVSPDGRRAIKDLGMWMREHALTATRQLPAAEPAREIAAVG